jgi:phenylacetate-CoA ligase
MDWHATLIRSMIGPLWARWESSPYLRHAAELDQRRRDTSADVRQRQEDLLRSLLRHAYDTVPYYRDSLDRIGLDPDDVHRLEDWSLLPVLTKADLRAHREALLSNRYNPATLRRKKTSGSTGVSLEVMVDEDSMQWKRACTLHADQWSGWRFGEPVAMLWGNPSYRQRGWRGWLRNTLLERAVYLDTLKMDEAALDGFTQQVRQQQPTLIFGHAHSVFLFAEYVRERGLTDIRPRGIITTAMVLHSWQRQVIEEVFGCRVTNRYGCEEVSLIACECECHEGLHVNSHGVYVELLRDGQPVRPGEAGSVVVTDLTNRAMPIIRYQVGDVAVWSRRACSCGRPLPLLQRLEGREADYVVTPRGELVSGISLTENFAVAVPGVAQLQIVQETVDFFRFRIVRGPDFGDASLARLRSLVAERFGPDVRYECEYLGRIPPEPSGKYRFCISKVEKRFSRPREVVAA